MAGYATTLCRRRQWRETEAWRRSGPIIASPAGAAVPGLTPPDGFATLRRIFTGHSEALSVDDRSRSLDTRPAAASSGIPPAGVGHPHPPHGHPGWSLAGLSRAGTRQHPDPAARRAGAHLPPPPRAGLFMGGP